MVGGCSFAVIILLLKCRTTELLSYMILLCQLAKFLNLFPTIVHFKIYNIILTGCFENVKKYFANNFTYRSQYGLISFREIP